MIVFEFLRFWILDLPKKLLVFFESLNNAFLEAISLSLLVKTYFRPWKNEYRKGLVGFSIGIGIFIKTFVIIADLILFFALLVVEFLIFAIFILLPFIGAFAIFYSEFSRFVVFPGLVVLAFLMFFSLRSKKSFKDIVASNKSGIAIVKKILKEKEIEFLLQKSGIKKEEISFIEIPKNAKINNAIDFFTDYLLSTEDRTKLLFNKKLKKDDLANISYWAKRRFEENESNSRIRFFGEGFAESWTYGWTLETKKYTVDLTPEILNKKPFFLGRQSEYSQLLNALSYRKSVLLVGEPGSGKNTLVESLSFESFSSDLKSFHHQRIFKLYLDTLLAGAQNQGEIQQRLDAIIEEISHSRNVIIYITDFENILGSSSFKIDLSGVLIPYLKNKSIRIIGTATVDAYRKFIQPLVNISNVFEVIKLDEPDRATVLQMLLDRSSSIEKKRKVSFSYRAILTCLDLADRYLIDRVLPGSAVMLLKDTANEVRLLGQKEVSEKDVVKRVEEKTKINVSSPSKEEKDLLINLEQKMHESLIDQQEAVKSIAEAVRRIRSGLKFGSKPISFLFLGPTGVGKTETAKVLSSLYFNGSQKMIRFDMSEYSTTDSVNRFIGTISGEGSEGISGKIHENPSSLILLDEFEKAHRLIHNLFLQILDDGRLTDGRGKTVSFANAIIVATSNAGSEFIREQIKKGTLDKNFKDRLLGYLLSKNIFRPEFLNRFDDVVIFKPLGANETVQIANLLLKDLLNKVYQKDIYLTFDEKISSKIAKEGSNEQFGARPLKRYIQDNIEDVLAQKILKEEIKRGDKVLVSLDNMNKITLIKTQ